MYKNSDNVDVIILAGGFGTRIRHITGVIPKPLAQVCNKPFLYWLFKNLKRYAFRRIFLLTHFGADLIENFAIKESKNEFVIQCIKETIPAGTGGCVIDFINGNYGLSKSFLLLNGDSILLNFDFEIARSQLKNGYSGVIFGVSMNDVSRYGILNYDNQMTLTSFEEKRPGSGIVNAGVYLFDSAAFTKIKNRSRPFSLERDLIPSMILNGEKIYVMKVESPFIDIGTEESFYEAEVFIKRYLL